jgi:hypothetical protein
MFRIGNGEVIERLTEENIHLKQENERLSRLQLSGPAAAIAQTIEGRLQEWADNGQVYDDASGLPVTRTDDVYELAIRQATQVHAGELMSAAEPAAQLKFIRAALTETEVRELASRGLERLVVDKPAVLSQLLDAERVNHIVAALTADETTRARLMERLLPTHGEITADELNRQIVEIGSFRTDNWPLHTKVDMELEYENGSMAYRISGRVVEGKDYGRWLRVSQCESYGKVMVLQPHKLIRLGHLTEDQQVVYEVVPEAPVRVLFTKQVNTNIGTINPSNTDLLRLTELTLNDEPVLL